MTDALKEAIAIIDATATEVDDAINKSDDVDKIIAATASAVFKMLKVQTLIIVVLDELVKAQA